MALGISSSTPTSFNPTSSSTSAKSGGGMGGELAMDVLKLVSDMMSLAGGQSAGGTTAPGASSGSSGVGDPGATDSSSEAGAADGTDPADPAEASAADDSGNTEDSKNPLKNFLQAFAKITEALGDLFKSLGSLFGGDKAAEGGTTGQPSGLNPLNPAQDQTQAQQEQSPIAF